MSMKTVFYVLSAQPQPLRSCHWLIMLHVQRMDVVQAHDMVVYEVVTAVGNQLVGCTLMHAYMLNKLPE